MDGQRLSQAVRWVYLLVMWRDSAESGLHVQRRGRAHCDLRIPGRGFIAADVVNVVEGSRLF